jgi:AcrR family transcriptional regulator
MSSPAEVQIQPRVRRGEGRQRILAEASALFQARGFADVSMQQIADAAGVTKATMYHHFRSKEELFTAVARELVNAFWAGIIARAEAGGPLRETMTSIADFIVSSPERADAGTLVEEMRRHLSPDVLAAIFTEHPEPVAALRGLFQRAIASGEMRPLDVDAVAGLFEGMVLSLGRSGHTVRQPTPDDAALLVDVFLFGIASPR